LKSSLKINVFTQPIPFVLSITLLFVLLSLLHGSTVRASSVQPGDLSVYLLKSTGGLFYHSSTLEVIRWTTATLPLLFFIYRMMVQLNGYDHYVMLRMRSRSKWWIEKFVSTVLVSNFYSLWYILVHVLVGYFLFSFPFSYDLASVGVLARLPVHSIPYRIDLIALLVFTTGLIALGSIAQIATLLCKKSVSMYLLFTLLLFVSGSLYVQKLIPRELSPMLYASSFDLFSNNFQHVRLMYALTFNVCVPLFCLFTGFFLIRSTMFSQRTE